MNDNGDDNGDEVLISLQSGSNHFRPIIHYVSLVCQFNLYVTQKLRQKPTQSVSFLSALLLLIQTQETETLCSILNSTSTASHNCVSK